MGRGRQKAKQTKVARELKYHTQSPDYLALQRELAGLPPESPPPEGLDGDGDEDSEDYSRYLPNDDDEPAGGYASHSRR